MPCNVSPLNLSGETPRGGHHLKITGIIKIWIYTYTIQCNLNVVHRTEISTKWSTDLTTHSYVTIYLWELIFFNKVVFIYERSRKVTVRRKSSPPLREHLCVLNFSGLVTKFPDLFLQVLEYWCSHVNCVQCVHVCVYHGGTTVAIWIISYAVAMLLLYDLTLFGV